MWERFPPRMRRVVTAALEEAGRGGSDEATPEHLLLAIARDPQSAASFMFEHAGVRLEQLTSQIQPLLPAGPAPLPRASRLAEPTVRVLESAVAVAGRVGDPHVGTEHVALALVESNGTPAARVLSSLGFTPARGEGALKAWVNQGMPRTRPGWSGKVIGSPVLRALLRPVLKLSHYPATAWRIFAHHSLAHPRFVTNPYPLYKKLREREPIRKDPLVPVWVITSYRGTFDLLRDPRFLKDPFAGERLPRAVREQLAAGPVSSARASAEMTSMLFLDPPQHTRVRSIFTRAFTPRRLESLRPRIQQITDRLLDAVQDRGEMDLMRDLAAPLPVTVIAELLGFPPQDYAKIKKWSDEMAEALGLRPSPQQAARAYQARMEIQEYFQELVARLRREPGDNLLSALLALEAQGEGLVGDELFSNSILLLAAGHETTTNLIGNGVLALLRHPDQLRMLRERPDELMESAVEEFLRYDPPVQWTSRVAGEDFEFLGRPLKRGDILLASVGAANRDPAVFPNPDALDIRRPDNKHLAFGTGIHFCLGAALARMEGEIAIGTLLRRMPNLRLTAGRVRWRKGVTFRGVHALPLKF